MPNDAKLGLVCGLGLVLAIAALFYRQEAFRSPTKDQAEVVKTEMVTEAASSLKANP